MVLLAAQRTALTDARHDGHLLSDSALASVQHTGAPLSQPSMQLARDNVARRNTVRPAERSLMTGRTVEVARGHADVVSRATRTKARADYDMDFNAAREAALRAVRGPDAQDVPTASTHTHNTPSPTQQDTVYVTHDSPPPTKHRTSRVLAYVLLGIGLAALVYACAPRRFARRSVSA